MSERILLLGGTKEAAELAYQLVADGHEVIMSLAGRTKEPLPVSGEVRRGGFGGAEAMANWIVDHGITKVIDATHPFATQISANAKQACERVSVSLDVRTRCSWTKQTGDIWIEADSLEDAAKAIPQGSTVLLALGSQHLAGFASRQDVHFIVRMIDEPKQSLPFQNHDLVLARPSNDWESEAKLLKKYGVTHIVCRNSGGKGAYAKIEAARRLAIPVIVVTMPI